MTQETLESCSIHAPNPTQPRSLFAATNAEPTPASRAMTRSLVLLAASQTTEGIRDAESIGRIRRDPRKETRHGTTQKQRNTPMKIITPDWKEALRMLESIIISRGGKRVEDGKIIFDCPNLGGGCSETFFDPRSGLWGGNMDYECGYFFDLADHLGIELCVEWGPGLNLGPGQRVVAVHEYADDAGNVICERLRLEPGRDGAEADYRVRKPNPELSREWIWESKPIPGLFYRFSCKPKLPKKGGMYWLVGSEEEVDLYMAHSDLPCVTTVPGGFLGWTNEHSEKVRGADVCLVPRPGEGVTAPIRSIAKSLESVAISVSVASVPGLHRTVSIGEFFSLFEDREWGMEIFIDHLSSESYWRR